MRVRVLVAAVAMLGVVLAAVAVLVAIRVNSLPPAKPSPTPAVTADPAQPRTPLPSSPGGHPIVYLYYYLWWTPEHWAAKLGSHYPLRKVPPPVPGAVDASGCSPKTYYGGSTIVDVPAQGLYNQYDEAVYAEQISQAAQAGVTGFLVSWQGTGADRQSPRASGYDQRLSLMVKAVTNYNATHPGDPFHLALALSAFGDYTRPARQITNDLAYFTHTYGRNQAFRNSFSSLPIVIIMDSRKYSLATVSAIWAAGHASAYLVGDETQDSWARDAPYLDATSYYWSSEDPTRNSRAQGDLESLASQVHGDGKKWFAPFIPGYNTQLLGGSCVPRNGVSTLESVWDVNATTDPDAWFGISWNEFVENTYLQPSDAYGSTYLNELRQLIQAG